MSWPPPDYWRTRSYRIYYVTPKHIGSVYANLYNVCTHTNTHTHAVTSYARRGHTRRSPARRIPVCLWCLSACPAAFLSSCLPACLLGRSGVRSVPARAHIAPPLPRSDADNIKRQSPPRFHRCRRRRRRRGDEMSRPRWRTPTTSPSPRCPLPRMKTSGIPVVISAKTGRMDIGPRRNTL